MTRSPVWVGAWLASAVLVAGGCGGSGISTSPLQSPSAGGSQSADPALAVVPGSGELVAGWIEGEGRIWTLYSAGSRNGGETWSSPVRVAGGAGAPEEVHPHGESSARLVPGPGGRLGMVWPNNIKVEGRKWPAAMLRFSRSEDGGLTWSKPITLNDDTTRAPVSHQFHGAAWVGDSGVVVAWLDEREAATPIAAGPDGHSEHAAEPDAAIYSATSADFGRTWGENRKAWTAACPCCRVSLARNRDGEAVAAWRKHFPGNVRDVVISTLGDAPSEPRRVHADDWAYAGCPHTGPALATAEDGSAHVVWYNGKQGDVGVYYGRQPARQGTGWVVGLVTGPRVGVAHPAVAVLADGGALAAYDVSPDGKRLIRVARVLPGGNVAGQVTADDSEGGKYPQLAVLDDSTAVVAWTASAGDKSGLRLARIRWR